MSIPAGWNVAGKDGSPGIAFVWMYVLPPWRVVESGCNCSILSSESWMIVVVADSIVESEAAFQ